MSELKKREIEILKILTKAEDYLPASLIAEKLNISTKTAYRDIEKIIEKRKDIVLKKKQGYGIKIEFIDEELEELDINKVTRFSVEERRIKIFFDLLRNPEQYNSIEGLAAHYYVGKSSIVNDLNYISNNLLGPNLSLEKSRKGTKIVGEERDIRRKFRELINNYAFITSEYTNGYKSERINNETLSEISTKFSIEDVEKVEKIVTKYEKRLPYTVGDLYYTNLVIHILIAIERVRAGNYIDFSRETYSISDKKFYNEAENIAVALENSFNIVLPAYEVYYLYQYLVSTGVGNLNSEDIIEFDSNVEVIIDKFLNEVLGNNHQINKDDHSYYVFKLHIRALLKRLKYHIEIKNPLKDKIKNTYKERFTNIANISKKVLDSEISDDEIAYLTIYVETILHKKVKKKNVILICHSGFGTSQFLKKGIEDSFDILNIIDVISSRDLKKYDLENIDFIISTVKLTETKKDTVYVNVLLQEEDIEKINRKIYGEDDGIFSL